MNDVARITELIAWDVIDMLWAIFYVVGVFVAMLFLNWKLALVIMLIVPAIAVLTWYFQNKILTWNRQVRKSIPRSQVATTKELWARKL